MLMQCSCISLPTMSDVLLNVTCSVTFDEWYLCVDIDVVGLFFSFSNIVILE